MQYVPVAASIAAFLAAFVPLFFMKEIYLMYELYFTYPLQISSVKSVLPSFTMICSIFTPRFTFVNLL